MSDRTDIEELIDSTPLLQEYLKDALKKKVFETLAEMPVLQEVKKTNALLAEIKALLSYPVAAPPGYGTAGLRPQTGEAQETPIDDENLAEAATIINDLELQRKLKSRRVARCENCGLLAESRASHLGETDDGAISYVCTKLGNTARIHSSIEDLVQEGWRKAMFMVAEDLGWSWPLRADNSKYPDNEEMLSLWKEWTKNAVFKSSMIKYQCPWCKEAIEGNNPYAHVGKYPMAFTCGYRARKR